uniref:Reverse transcriptase domain-containing protein n=1 Tax=Tanacetum cinerariifolium TaxID=118510 RepID=A0A699U300_TANCI|nr:hypothetical protein [Tanacetum cinerariifolium]
MFRICPDKIYRKAKKVPNTVSASSRTKPITVSQPFVITKKNVNFDLNGLSSTGLDNTKTRRPQPRSDRKNDRVPSASKSSRSKNKKVKIAQPGMNMGQDRQMQIVGGNGGNQFRQYTGQNAGNPTGYNDVIRNQVIQNAV